MPPGARVQLAGVGLRRPDQLGHLPRAVAERLAQHVGRALGRRQALQQREQGEGDALPLDGVVERPERTVRGEHRLGQPRPDVDLPPGAGRVQRGQAEVGDHADQERLRRPDGRPVDGLPAQPGVLQDVLGVGGRPEHPVGDPEQPRAQGLELGEPGGGIVGHRIVAARPQPSAA